MRIPIRLQFMIPMLVVASTGLVVIAAFNARSASRQTKYRIEQQIRGVVEVLTNSNFPLTNRVLSQMGELAGAELVLTSDDGVLLASSEFDIDTDDLPTAGEPATSVDEISLGPPIKLDGDYYYASLQMPARSSPFSAQELHILFPCDQFNMAWQRLFLPPFVVGAATLTIVGLVTHIVAVRISRVLGNLQRGVRGLADGGVEPVTVPPIEDEIHDLAKDVNQTAERLAKYEEEVRDAEQLRTLNLLGAGLAHEIRNAATGCRMAIDLYGEELDDQSKSDSCLEVARGQLQLIERRLREFLHLTDTTTRECRCKISLNSAVNEVLHLISPSARHSGVRLDWRNPPAVYVMADPDQLAQVVMNLALNALHAAAKQQAANGTQAYFRAEVNEVGETVELRVADSGAGPSEAVADKLFESFVTDKPEGIGLGLAVARRVVESLAGEISWCRQADETQFVVRLPAVKGEEADG